MAFSGFALVPETQILFIGAMACTRHRAQELTELQKQGRLSFLCLDEVDFITGRYLSKIEEAITELVEARHPGGIYLTAGCQAALLSTDWQLLIDKMEAQTGVPIRAHTGCHLCGVQHDAGAADEDSVDSMVYDMLQKAERSQEVSVNVLTTGELAPDSELRQLLTGAGVEHINLLRECKTFAQYQEMASAHLNIVCVEDGGEALGQRLQARLGIPYVVLGACMTGQNWNAPIRPSARPWGSRWTRRPTAPGWRPSLPRPGMPVRGIPSQWRAASPWQSGCTRRACPSPG